MAGAACAAQGDAGRRIAQSAAQQDLTDEVSGAENDPGAVGADRRCDCQDVRERMLAVAIGTHDVVVREVVGDVREPLLEGVPLAPVGLVFNHRRAGEPQALEYRIEARVAPIVDDEDMMPSLCRDDRFDEGDQFVVGFVGRNENDHDVAPDSAAM